MRYALLAQLLLLTSVARGGDKSATCELASKSIIGRSSSGVAQVTNLGSIEVKCRIPARPFPSKAGESRNGVSAATSAYQIFPDGNRASVPSEVKASGGGRGAEDEWVNFALHIPLDYPEREAEARRYLEKLYKSMAPDQIKQITEDSRRKAEERLRDLIYQDRVGHFQVECRVTDGDRVIGIGIVEFEVLFKGRFSDVGMPAQPSA